MAIKFKLFYAISFIVLTAMAVCAYFAWEALSEDKRLAVMDLNQALLHGVTSDLKLDLKGRLDELQIFLPRAFSPEAREPFRGLSAEIPNELLEATFYRKTEKGYEVVREYRNQELIARKQLPPDLSTQLTAVGTLPFELLADQSLVLLNRSLPNAPGASLVTFLMTGTSLSEAGQGIVIAVDYTQDFLRKRLARSDLAEIFLLFRNGTLLAHRSGVITSKYATAPYPHPIVARLKNKQFPRESVELVVDNEAQYVNVAETGFHDLYAVAQTRKSDSLSVAMTLAQKGGLIAAMSLALALIVSLIFGSRLASRLNRIGLAVDRMAQGELDVKIDVKGRDEVARLGRRVGAMSSRLGELMAASAATARDAGEGETARLVHSTLLTEPHVNSPAFELVSLFQPAPSGGSNFWDAHHGNRFVTVLIGDTSTKGVPGALAMAMARGSFHALCESDPARPPEPASLLSAMNRLFYQVCHGTLTLSACVAQLDMESGELSVAAAAHAGPVRLRDKQNDIDVERLTADGPLLGAKPEAAYKAARHVMAVGDRILFHTQGITEAVNEAGEAWGKNGLRAALGEDLTSSAATLKARIEAAFVAHVGSAKLEEDVTLAVFHWTHKASEVMPRQYEEDSPSIWDADAKGKEAPKPRPDMTEKLKAPVASPRVTRDVAPEAAQEDAPKAPAAVKPPPAAKAAPAKAAPKPAPAAKPPVDAKPSSRDFPAIDLDEVAAKRDAYLYEGKELLDDDLEPEKKAA